jgi:ABC-type multidrug transport system ATPase subunit
MDTTTEGTHASQNILPPASRSPPSASLPGILVQQLSVVIHQRTGERDLLRHVSFRFPSSCFIAIIGASGCGKSTLIRALVGIQRASQGSVLLAGHPILELKRHFPLAVGFLPQFGTFHPELTVEENLRDALALRLPKSVSRDIRESWLRHIVELAGIEALLSQLYATLSGGQMRRVALAEALIGDPEFLFLDELTSGLDVYSDQEMMLWLRQLAHDFGKTVVLVTHSTYHLHYCDSIIFLHEGRMVHHGNYESLLEGHGASTVAEVFAMYQTGQMAKADEGAAELGRQERSPTELGNEAGHERADGGEAAIEPQPLKTGRPPSGFWQFPTLLVRQGRLFWRDKGQLWLHFVLIVTFPCLVAVFAVHGLPTVRSLTLSLEKNVLFTLQEQLFYLKESFHAASIISGLAMFQVVLLTLIGANNGAREIAKEKEILEKELRTGLSPTAYVLTKLLQVVALSLVQAFWMAWFVKTVCGFPGDLFAQFAILFATTLAMSATCLAISAAARSPERASLLAIYIVGFQLPLSGAALSLPDWLSSLCRPFIVAYWGWSGYLQTLHSTRHYDIVSQSTHTTIADYRISVAVLISHALIAAALARYFVERRGR